MAANITDNISPLINSCSNNPHFFSICCPSTSLYAQYGKILIKYTTYMRLLFIQALSFRPDDCEPALHIYLLTFILIKN